MREDRDLARAELARDATIDLALVRIAGERKAASKLADKVDYDGAR